MLWLLVFVPLLFAAAKLKPEAHTLFVASVALLIPSAVAAADSATRAAFTQQLSVGLAVLLIVAYALSMLYSLKTHSELFTSAEHADEGGEGPWPMGLAPAFVGFIAVALVGGAAEMASAFSGARKNRLDLSVGIALGSASQIALFVAPVLVLLKTHPPSALIAPTSAVPSATIMKPTFQPP